MHDGQCGVSQTADPVGAAGAARSTQPVDMTTRMISLQTAISDSVDAGTAETAGKKAALAFAFEGLDANAFYVQTIARMDLRCCSPPVTRRPAPPPQTQLDTPSITGIDNDISTQLDVHLSPISNAVGYEVQICTGTGAWTTATFSTQARTVTLTGLTTGTVYQVRARALGGSTGRAIGACPAPALWTDLAVGHHAKAEKLKAES